MGKVFLKFTSDSKGFGELTLGDELSYKARSGSIDSSGNLKNVIASGVWTIREPSVDTDEPGMVITPGMGWKSRLFTPIKNQWSHYLIHPDGNKPGTLGCIGIINQDAIELRDAIDAALMRQEFIEVYANMSIPEGPVTFDPKIPIRPDKMRGMDAFFTTSIKPSGAVIRLTVNGPHRMFDMDIPTHTGFCTEDHGQFFASEATPRGFIESSFDKYKKRWDRMHSVWRWDGFNDDDIRYAAQSHLARLRRNRVKYDWRGLLPFVPWIRRTMPWIKQDPTKDFCSENEFSVFKRYGLKDYPKQWDKRPPSPYALITHFCERDDFHRIDCL